jgi:hypothetical protein
MKDKFSARSGNPFPLWASRITQLSWINNKFFSQDEFGTNIFKDLRMSGSWI